MRAWTFRSPTISKMDSASALWSHDTVHKSFCFQSRLISLASHCGSHFVFIVRRKSNLEALPGLTAMKPLLRPRFTSSPSYS